MGKLETYDKNMLPVEVKGEMAYYNPLHDDTFVKEGLPWIKHNGNYNRLPNDSNKVVTDGVYWLMRQPSGGMIRFSTDSAKISIRIKNLGDYEMCHMPACGQQGADLYFKRDCDDSYCFYGVTKFAAPATEFECVVFESVTKEHKDILIHLPLYEELGEILIGVDKDAVINPPCKRKREGKLVVYGTSSTQGGCASRPGMSYPNIISRRLDMEFVNLGFSGSGLGEPFMADFLVDIPDVKLFLLDYDGNGGGTGHLEKYMDEFVAGIRKGYPDVPILIVSKHPFTCDRFIPSLVELRERLVKFQKDFVEKRSAYDKNIYFYDGNKVFGDTDIYEMTVDGIHPTDLGFYTIANVLTPVIKEILDKTYPEEANK